MKLRKSPSGAYVEIPDPIPPPPAWTYNGSGSEDIDSGSYVTICEVELPARPTEEGPALWWIIGAIHGGEVSGTYDMQIVQTDDMGDVVQVLTGCSAGIGKQHTLTLPAAFLPSQGPRTVKLQASSGDGAGTVFGALQVTEIPTRPKP